MGKLVLMFIAFLFVGSPVFADGTECDAYLLLKIPSAEYLAFAARPTEEIETEFLKNMAESLIRENIAVFVRAKALESSVQSKIVVLKVSKIASHQNYPYFKALVNIETQGKTGEIELFFRTNGQAGFLSSTWRLERNSRTGQLHLNAILKSKNGRFTPVGQNKIVLDNLPPLVTLSRSMSNEELRLWQEGGIEKINSQDYYFGAGIDVAPKTTFALNYFKFKNNEPQSFSLPREVLVDLDKRGLLSVNTYEDITNSPKGMPIAAQTSFGIEVELVVHGLEGRSVLQPYMVNPK